SPICLRLFRHSVRAAAARARCTAGTSRPISTAMIAMTTSSSMRVKPDGRRDGFRMACFRVGAAQVWYYESLACNTRWLPGGKAGAPWPVRPWTAGGRLVRMKRGPVGQRGGGRMRRHVPWWLGILGVATLVAQGAQGPAPRPVPVEADGLHNIFQ